MRTAVRAMFTASVKYPFHISMVSRNSCHSVRNSAWNMDFSGTGHRCSSSGSGCRLNPVFHCSSAQLGPATGAEKQLCGWRAPALSPDSHLCVFSVCSKRELLGVLLQHLAHVTQLALHLPERRTEAPVRGSADAYPDDTGNHHCPADPRPPPSPSLLQCRNHHRSRWSRTQNLFFFGIPMAQTPNLGRRSNRGCAFAISPCQKFNIERVGLGKRSICRPI